MLILFFVWGYVRDYWVFWRVGGVEFIKVDVFDLFYGYGFVLEGCNGGGSDGELEGI